MKKKVIGVIGIIAIACNLLACGSTNKQEKEESKETYSMEIDTIEADSIEIETIETKSESVTFTDGLGYEIVVTNPQKVAVLSGSFAETWLLAGGTLSAVTEDVYSERNLEIGENVVDLGALKSPNLEMMIEANVDFAILSAKIDEHIALRDTLEKVGITTAYFDVETFEDYLNMLKICTDITGSSEMYQKNGLDVQEKIYQEISRVDGTSKTVLFIRAYSTGAKAKGSDNMTGIMLKDLGCTNIADGNNVLLEDLSMEVIIQDDPDYIFVTTMGEDGATALQSVEDMLISNPAWNELSAVKNNQYYVLPKNLFHNKPNNRWGESYEILANILYE